MGQESRGLVDQVQVCYGGPIRSVLILAQPQQLLTVLEERFHGPALFIRLQPSRGRECRIVRHESEDQLCSPLTREDDVPRAQGTHLQPASMQRSRACSCGVAGTDSGHRGKR